MSGIEDHRWNVRCGDTVGRPRSSLLDRARRPVLTELVVEQGIDQLQRFPKSVSVACPDPATMSMIRRVLPAALAPVAVIGVGHLVAFLPESVPQRDCV